MMKRDDILRLDDAQLSACCKLEFYKDSGPGGQKRNKASSAARVTLSEFGISATDCTERSQVRNRANALHKLRITLALTVRETPAVPPERLECSLSHADYPLYLAHLLDVYSGSAWDFRIAAAALGISPTAFVKKLYKDPVVWQMVIKELTSRDLPLLRPPK